APPPSTVISTMKAASSTTLVVSLAAAALGLLGLTLLLLRSPETPHAAPGTATGSVAIASGQAGDSASNPAPTRTTVGKRPQVAEVQEGFRVALAAEAKQAAESPQGGSSPQPSGVHSSDQGPAPNHTTIPSSSSFSSSPSASSVSVPVPVAGTVPPSASANVSVVTADTRLWLPAAMLEPDKSIPISTELQVAEWERLQDLFVEAVGGRAPGDQASRENWVSAQQKSDDLFRQKFGWDAFRTQQMKAYREGLAPNF
ncbi:MAG: hypothetical protein ACOYOL_04970, partial [Chthoniobacterales bacterium]